MVIAQHPRCHFIAALDTVLLLSTSTISEGDGDDCTDGLVDGERDGDRDGITVGA